MPGTVPHRTDPGEGHVLVVGDVAPAGFVSLCWKVFFESRGRGASMQAHFPWLAVPGQAFFVTLGSSQEVLAGCAIRPIADRTGQWRAGAIGLVCVDPSHRGEGHSTRVIERVKEHAARMGLVDLVLWTSHPGLYERHGFRPDDNALFGTISAPGTAATAATGGLDIGRSAWPPPGDKRGLPPFATQAVRWQSQAASAIVLQGADGGILAEWTGADNDVASLLAQVVPTPRRMNALASDSLPGVLAERGWAVRLAPARLRMIRTSDGHASPRRAYDLRVLDRI
jgi:GNAT superfamily N-acetyltransferase